MEKKTRIRYAAMIVGFVLATLTAIGAAYPDGPETGYPAASVHR